jgi:hypothetical protein
MRLYLDRHVKVANGATDETLALPADAELRSSVHTGGYRYLDLAAVGVR